MSWFDKLFGEETPSDQTSSENKRSTAPKKTSHHLIPQTNDVYQRPRGKFRFPIMMDYETSNTNKQQNVKENKTRRDAQISSRPSYGIDRKSRRHRTHGVSHGKPTQVYQSNRTRPSQQHTASQLFQDIGSGSKEKLNNDQLHRTYRDSTPNQAASSSRTQHQHTTYAKPTKEFKASEVPSAIFGTQERKSIKNSGLSQPPGTRANPSQTSMNKQGERKKTPNHSKRDNTINIENIYASQIVDEIRREREKKIQQKKRFKEALQQKRAIKEEDPHADIQKAIDAMHASQARHLLGEDYVKSAENDWSNSNEATSCSPHEDKDFISPDTNVSSIEYEEIDLSQIGTDVNEEPEATIDDNDDNNSYKDESVCEHVISDANSQHARQSNVSSLATTNDADLNLEQNTQESQLDVDEVDGYDMKDSKKEHTFETTLRSHDMDYSNSNVNEVQDEDAPAESHNIEQSNKEVVQVESSTNVDVPQPNDNMAQYRDSQGHFDDIKADPPVAKQNEPILKPEVKQTQNVNKVPIRKGSKPFNVVMTPSDKKRMLERRKAEQNARPSTSNNKTQVIVQDKQATSEESIASKVKPSSERVNSPEIVSASQVNVEVKDEEKKIRRGPVLNLPSVDLLDQPEIHEKDNAWIEEKQQQLNDAFYYFNVPAEVVNVIEGPSVTRFELSVERGVKVSRITALQDDIKMALAAKDIRIEAPIPGTSLVGIEVPNQHPTKVNLRSILETPAFKHAESKLTVAMGTRINNEPLLMDIAKTPHALIAGATGSGKSVSINSILLSLLYRNHPEELKLLLIDPKMVELAPYNDLPHLVAPVITDVKAATQSLKWAVEEMERRYKLFAQTHVRNITAFNKKVNYDQRMPKIVIVIDELADLMMMAPQDVEQSIARIAQKARACGIHMLVATQRPSVNVITGLIKANIPTRIAFMVSSSVDSRTILDSGGAERLLGYGDMLYLGGGMNKPIRVQGTFVSDEEIDEVVEYIKSQREPEYLFQEKELLKKTEEPTKDELFNEVCEFMVKERHISTSLIQRHFQIGYNRAARIIDQLEQLGYISGANGSKPRDVFLTEADLQDS